MHSSFRTLTLVASMSAAGLLAACGGGGGETATPPPGTLGVSLTDAPSCGYDAVNVTVRAVRVHQSSSAGENEGGWSDITLPVPKKINLLDLTNGVLETLGETSLPAGHYTQLRLVLDPNNGNSKANSIVLTTDPTNTTEISLDTPSAVQSGIKLNGDFDVVSGQRVDLVLDFDACKSIVTKGNGGYALKPVINIIPTVLNGIDGYVNPALLASKVSVSAQQNGAIIRATVPDANGKFTLARLAPGNYDVVITADSRATAVIGTVPVVSTSSRVDVSTSAAPINLLASATRKIDGTVSLTPTSTTAVAYVAAQQTFNAGPKVTVKYRGADIADGTYSLANLPIAAPQYGVYSPTLPIALTTQTTTTPGTAKYQLAASATGYTTKTITSVDLTTTDQAGVNFALVP